MPLTKAEESLVRALRGPRRRAPEGLFLAEGVRVVEELLDAGVVLRLVMVSSTLEDTPRGRALTERLMATSAPRAITPGRLAELAATRSPQGVVVVAETPLADLASIELPDDARFLVLDGVQDPGNVGTLARAAAAFGCQALVCLPGTVDPWNAKAVRASAGALVRLAVVATDVRELLGWLERHDVTLLGADAGGDPITGLVPPGRIALAVGNEGAGLTKPVRAGCHRLVAVPMRGGIESLNVALATGILLYELTRERG